MMLLFRLVFASEPLRTVALELPSVPPVGALIELEPDSFRVMVIRFTPGAAEVVLEVMKACSPVKG